MSENTDGKVVRLPNVARSEVDQQAPEVPAHIDQGRSVELSV